MNARQALVFAILMQHIEDVSPDYLAEKLEMCQALEAPEGLLDSSNLALLKQWEATWIGCACSRHRPT